MSIQQLCNRIMQPRPAWENMPLGCKSALGVSLLFGRSGFGITTLSLQIAEKASETGKVLFFSMESSGETIKKRMKELRIADASILIEDKPCIGKNELLSLVKQHPDASLVILDYLQVFNGNIRDLADVYEQSGIPVLVLSQLNRVAEDNPDRAATYTDIVWQLTKYHDIFPGTLKAVRKFCINRSHICERNISTAYDYDISNKTSVCEYDANGLFAEYKLLWNPDKLCFSDKA